MDDESSLIWLISFWALVCHIFNYFKARGNKEHIMSVPKSISILFGAPIGIGKITANSLILGSANLISYLIALLIYFFYNKVFGTDMYWYLWISLTFVGSFYESIRFKEY